MFLCVSVCLFDSVQRIKACKNMQNSEKECEKKQNRAEISNTPEMDEFLTVSSVHLPPGGHQGGPEYQHKLETNEKQHTRRWKSEKNTLFERWLVFRPKTEGSTAV